MNRNVQNLLLVAVFSLAPHVSYAADAVPIGAGIEWVCRHAIVPVLFLMLVCIAGIAWAQVHGKAEDQNPDAVVQGIQYFGLVVMVAVGGIVMLSFK